MPQIWWTRYAVFSALQGPSASISYPLWIYFEDNFPNLFALHLKTKRTKLTRYNFFSTIRMIFLNCLSICQICFGNIGIFGWFYSKTFPLVERETLKLFATVDSGTRRSSKCLISSASTALLEGLPARLLQRGQIFKVDVFPSMKSFKTKILLPSPPPPPLKSGLKYCEAQVKN